MLDDNDVVVAAVAAVVEDRLKEIVNDYLLLTMMGEYIVDDDDDDSLMSSVNQMQRLNIDYFNILQSLKYVIRKYEGKKKKMDQSSKHLLGIYKICRTNE
jgi:uncharacterized protein YpuA (DUF1002 family)